MLNELKANDIISVGASIESTSGTVNDHVPARITLLKKPTLAAPVITIAQTSAT